MGPAAQLRARTLASRAPGERGGAYRPPGVSSAGLALPALLPFTHSHYAREDSQLTPRTYTRRPGRKPRVGSACAAGGAGSSGDPLFRLHVPCQGWQL